MQNYKGAKTKIKFILSSVGVMFQIKYCHIFWNVFFSIKFLVLSRVAWFDRGLVTTNYYYTCYLFIKGGTHVIFFIGGNITICRTKRFYYRWGTTVML